MNRTRIQLLFAHILNASILMWVLLGFSISYLFFFIFPIFLTSRIMQFPQYVQAMNPIGIDLKTMLSYSESWFVAKQTPYIANNLGSNLHPPLASVLFAPLLLIPSTWVYTIVTLVNVFCYVMITFVFPLRISKDRKDSPILILIFITGLFSYGFQFELERGQFNVIAVLLCFLSIWIYHYHNKFRYLSYILFTISVQLKIYPFIFIVMLISNWQDLRNNFKRFLLLAIANLVLLFVFGTKLFIDFINAIKNQQIRNSDSWIGNHSIRSFVTIVAKKAPALGWTWIKNYSGLVQIVLLVIVVGCIFLILFQTYRQGQTGINPLLLLACTIGACLIPSSSHDYTLSILAGPVAILFLNKEFWERAKSPRLQIIFIVLLLVSSFAYSSTLFSYTNKPFLMLQNDFPALVTLLLVITILSLLSKPNFEVRCLN